MAIHSASSLLLFGFAFGIAAGGSACRSGPTAKPAVSVADKSDSEVLYHAALETFRSRGFEIDVASEDYMIVTSRYEPISDRLRRRFTARIVRLDGGATALRVRAEHQRRHGEGEEAVWKKVDSEVLQKRAEREELELGRSIERRYRRWKEYGDRNSAAGGGEGDRDAS